MKLINSSVEVWKQKGYDVENILKHIEKCGRVCYKSEDKITTDSYIKFTNMLKSAHHFSVFEHGTVYLKIWKAGGSPIVDKYKRNPYSRVVSYWNSVQRNVYDSPTYYITTNMRVILENDWEDDLQFICEPTEYHEKRITAHFICSIGISREFNRHRVDSVSEQSTRYCNYSKNKFGNELTFIKPEWVANLNSKGYTEKNSDSIREFFHMLEANENSYMLLINKGLKPQEAREVLPLSTATELIHTAYKSDWDHFFDLRTANSAHPDAQKLANSLKNLIYNADSRGR
jgi:thymidylate synthase (FAD)